MADRISNLHDSVTPAPGMSVERITIAQRLVDSPDLTNTERAELHQLKALAAGVHAGQLPVRTPGTTCPGSTTYRQPAATTRAPRRSGGHR